jgi:hypothetical protein
VAGLVAAAQVIRVIGFRQGWPSWTVDILRGAKWAPGAELTLQPAADGVAVVWRDGVGPLGAGTLVLVGPHGETRGPPVEVGAAACTTAGGVAWIEPRRAGPVRVLARAWADTEPREAAELSSDRSPTLACGARSVFVLGDGDDDLTVDVLVPNDPTVRRPALVLRDSDFADEEREHEAFTVADDLELVRVGIAGGIATRTVTGDNVPSPWRKLKHALSDDDDLVGVDGDPSRTFLLFTRDDGTSAASPGRGRNPTDARCPAGQSERVRALDVSRKGADVLLELAPADCSGQRGPFWVSTGFAGARGPVLAWVERGAHAAPAVAPISALAYRVVQPDGIAEGRVEASADALVDGGCDDAGCFAAALLREPGTDGISPGAVALLKYP